MEKAAEQAEYIQAESPELAQLDPDSNRQNVRTPIERDIPTPIPVPDEPLPTEFEEVQMESVEPGSDKTFDPFTFGREGSPYGPDGVFSPGGAGGACTAPFTVPLSPDFADPGDLHGNITILGNGDACGESINFRAPNVAIEFSALFATTVQAPWSLVSLTAGSSITVTNGQVTMRFTFTRSPTFITVTKVEFL